MDQFEYRVIDRAHEIEPGQDVAQWIESLLAPFGEKGYKILSISWWITDFSTEKKRKETVFCQAVLKRPVSNDRAPGKSAVISHALHMALCHLSPKLYAKCFPQVE